MSAGLEAKEPFAPGIKSRAWRWQALAGPALLALTFTLLSGWTWRKWPDLLVDFGRELYIP